MKLANAFIVLVILGSNLASAEEPRWTVRWLDPCGCIPASDLFPKKPSAFQKKVLADLVAGRYSDAWVGFRGLYRQDDDSPFHIWGMAISACKTNKLASAADEVAAQASIVRQGELARGGGRTPPKGTARHIVAFNLVRSMMAVEGKRSPLSGRAEIWFSILLLEPLPASEKRREMILLYSAAMFGMNEIGKSRRWLKAWVDAHPKESRGRLLLAKALSQGVERMVDGHGKELPVPDEDRINLPLAQKYAVEAARLEPKWAEAQYIAGRECAYPSPEQARIFLKRYLQLEKNPPPLRRAVVEQYLKTGKWGVPPPEA